MRGNKSLGKEHLLHAQRLFVMFLRGGGKRCTPRTFLTLPRPSSWGDGTADTPAGLPAREQRAARAKLLTRRAHMALLHPVRSAAPAPQKSCHRHFRVPGGTTSLCAPLLLPATFCLGSSAGRGRHEQRGGGLHGAEAGIRPVFQPLVRREVPEGGKRRRPLRPAL